LEESLDIVGTIVADGSLDGVGPIVDDGSRVGGPAFPSEGKFHPPISLILFHVC
jgi:hypothetical protein